MSLETTAKDWLSDPAWNRVRDIENMLQLFRSLKISFLIQFNSIQIFSAVIISHKRYYSETLNNEYIERIHQLSYSSLSNNGMLQLFSFLIVCLYGTI